MGAVHASFIVVLRAVIVLVVLAPGTACTAEGGERSASADWQSAPVAEVAVRIGMDEGPEEYLFGDITSVAADTDGRIYVADRVGSTIRVYGRDGGFLRQVGREGQGPGEYQWPADLTFGPDGRLYVRDNTRITVLAAAEAGGIPDSVAATWRIPGLSSSSSRRSRVDSAGNYYYPSGAGGPLRYFYLIFPRGEHRGDTVHVPAFGTLSATLTAFYRIGADGRMLDGLSHAPFEPVATWDITPRGTVVGGDGSSQTILESGATADSVGALRGVRVSRRPVPAGERADSARALQHRIDSLAVPLAEVQNASAAVRTGSLPDSLPAYRSVHVAIEGDIWVERWPLEGDAGRRLFDVFASDGTYVGAIVLAAPLVRDPPPFFTSSAVFGVVRDSATGVERVATVPVRLDRGSGR